jgi:hypothetical protein
MEQLIISFFVLVLVGFGCKKEATTISPMTSGSWNWISTWGDIPESTTNPMTPQNSGIQENLLFNSNFHWKRILNGSPSDSGTFSLGHGSYAPYQGAYTYIYDSIILNYQNGRIMPESQNLRVTNYYRLTKDTLFFCGCFRGLIGAGVTTFVKE